MVVNISNHKKLLIPNCHSKTQKHKERGQLISKSWLRTFKFTPSSNVLIFQYKAKLLCYLLTNYCIFQIIGNKSVLDTNEMSAHSYYSTSIQNTNPICPHDFLPMTIVNSWLMCWHVWWSILLPNNIHK